MMYKIVLTLIMFSITANGVVVTRSQSRATQASHVETAGGSENNEVVSSVPVIESFDEVGGVINDSDASLSAWIAESQNVQPDPFDGRMYIKRAKPYWLKLLADQRKEIEDAVTTAMIKHYAEPLGACAAFCTHRFPLFGNFYQEFSYAICAFQPTQEARMACTKDIERIVMNARAKNEVTGKCRDCVRFRDMFFAYALEKLPAGITLEEEAAVLGSVAERRGGVLGHLKNIADVVLRCFRRSNPTH